MSKIIIQEVEETKLVDFDITENSVLIPMLYTRTANFKMNQKLVVEEGSEETSEFTFDDDTMITLENAKRIRADAKVGEYVIANVKDQATGRYKVESFSALPDAAQFNNANTFASWISGHIVVVDDVNDKSYLMAHTLLKYGMSVIVKPLEFDQTYPIYDPGAILSSSTQEMSESAYHSNLMANICTNYKLEEFKDRNKWNFKFITTGGHPNFLSNVNDSGQELFDQIQLIAKTRGDAIALAELDSGYQGTDDEDTINKLSTIAKPASEHAAMFFPRGNHKGLIGITNSITMPACFAYLLAYANSVKSNANWFAASGAIRGEVPTLVDTTYHVGEALMHVLQGDDTYTSPSGTSTTLNIRINPIYDASTYGYRVWGNRVMLPTNESLQYKFVDFLNVRILLCDIRKQVYHAAMRVMFEPNDDIAWFNFKSLTNTLLDKMKSGRGLMWYKWTKQQSTNKGTLDATLTIRPIEGLETINVTISMNDSEVEVEEEI